MLYKATPFSISNFRPGVYTVRVVANNGVSEIRANKSVNETTFCPVGEFETSFEDGKEVSVLVKQDNEEILMLFIMILYLKFKLSNQKT